jgi:nucleotide-binding universal stress UspA family protein
MDLAKALNKPIHTITVVQGVANFIQGGEVVASDPAVVEEYSKKTDSHAAKLLAEVRSLASERQIEVNARAVTGDPVDAIMEALKEHECDLLIVGLRVHPGLLERLVPNTSRQITERAPCCIMGVR